MIRGYTAQQLRDAEAPHLAAGEPLMARAAHALAEQLRGLLPEARGRVLLLVGAGSNGGDALFAGAELAASGAGASAEESIEVDAVAVGSRMHGAGRQAAVAAGVRLREPDARLIGELQQAVAYDVVVDGILGTGAGSGTSGSSPALRGAARDVVRALLAAPALPPVVAVDIPSGIDPDSGQAPDEVVLPAQLTVTFGGVKAGLLRGRGRQLAGEVVLVPIGIEPELAAMTPAVELDDDR